MAFIKFTDVGKSFAARVSINPRGMLNFTEGAKLKFSLQNYGYAVLYYDKDTSVIGIELTTDEAAEGAIRIRHRTTGADLGIKSFLDFFGITPAVTSMYEIKAGDTASWINIYLATARERKSGKDDDDLESLLS